MDGCGLDALPFLIDCGLPADHPPLKASARKFIDDNLTAARANDPKWLMNRMDLCHLGFWLRIGSYYLGKDARLAATATFVAETALPDGGFNCRIRTKDVHHSSFHTTFNVLEGLTEAARAGNIDAKAFRKSEAAGARLHAGAQALSLGQDRRDHRRALHPPDLPSHWHYTVLRGLDYIRETPEIGDKRLDDPIAMIESRRKPNGRWVTEKRIPGVEHFDNGKVGRREPLGDTQSAADIEGA